MIAVRRRPVRVTTKNSAVSRRRKRPREEAEALSIILKESRPFSTVALFPFLVKHGTAARPLCVSVYMPLSTSRTARRMPAAPFLQATAQAPPRLNCILPVLPCPEVIVSGARTDGASWEKRLPQDPQALKPEAASKRMLL